MRYRTLWPGGPSVSVLGLGGWSLAGATGAVSRALAVRTIDHALDLGCTLIDTAAVYYHSEALLGEALAGRRERVFLTTKVRPEDLTRERIFASVEQSLQRLRTDRIDLVHAHRFPPGASLDEVCGAFEDLIAQGKMLYPGLCTPDGELAARMARRLPQLVLQWRYNLLYREAEEQVLPLCASEGLGFLAFSPLNLGILSGRFQADHHFAGDDDRVGMEDFQPPRFGRLVAASHKLAALAAARGCTPIALAVGWVLRRPEVTCALMGAKRPEQVDDYLAGLAVTFDDELLREVDAIVSEAEGGPAGAGEEHDRPAPAGAVAAARFRDRVVVITGAGGGMGAEAAVAFAKEGAHVVIADVNPFTARQTLERTFPFGGRSRWVWTDVDKDYDLLRLVRVTLRDFGRIDVLINNAGDARHAGREIEELTPRQWMEILSINIRQTFLCTSAALPAMLRQGKGVIINTASIYGVTAGSDLGYDASKGGIPAFTRSLTVSYAAKGIRAVCVAPGHMVTRRTVHYHRQHDLTGLYPAGYLGSDLDIVNAYLFLASDAAGWTNGVTLAVDGGFLAR